MKKKKLELNELKVSSFVTNLSRTDIDNFKGGSPQTPETGDACVSEFGSCDTDDRPVITG